MLNPTRTIDLSAPMGAVPGFFTLDIYDDATARRFAISQGLGSISVPWAALPTFQAAVGGQQLFLSAPVDLTTTPSGIALVPALAGYFFVPANNDPLMVVNLSSAGTLTNPPLVRYGNPSSSGNMGGGSAGGDLDGGTFGQPAKTIRSSFLAGPITLADLATPITLDVVRAATGTGGLAWSVRFAIIGSIVPAF
jgi:hypothetical protein